MNNQNYTAAIEVANSQQDVFKHITNVSKWWGERFVKKLSELLTK